MNLLNLFAKAVNNFKRLSPNTLYRTSLVRMYYSTVPTSKTPTPFLELRAWIITDKPASKRWVKILNKELDWLQDFVLSGSSSAKFKTKMILGEIKYEIQTHNLLEVVPGGAVTPSSYVTYEIVGSEFNRPIDKDEAIGSPEDAVSPINRMRSASFFTTGLPPDEWRFYQVYRYACFFKKNGDIKRDYNEAEIRRLEVGAKENYKRWLEYMIAFPEYRESYIRWLFARRGLEWKPGYTVSKPYIWHGRPVFTVRYKGRFVKGGIIYGRPLSEGELKRIEKMLR